MDGSSKFKSKKTFLSLAPVFYLPGVKVLASWISEAGNSKGVADGDFQKKKHDR